jgi:hypothetical protein
MVFKKSNRAAPIHAVPVELGIVETGVDRGPVRLSIRRPRRIMARTLGSFLTAHVRITTRTFPPTRRSTSAYGVSQSGAQWNQRRLTSGLVQAFEDVLGQSPEGPLDTHHMAGLLGHRRSFHSSRYSQTTSKRRSQRCRWLSIQSEASASASGRRAKRWILPQGEAVGPAVDHAGDQPGWVVGVESKLDHVRRAPELVI